MRANLSANRRPGGGARWGEPKADPAELLARYLDVHVYFANWGSRRALTGFLRVDPDLLAAAAEAGGEGTGEMERFRSWVERLPAREQQRWLLRAADSLDLAVGSALLGEFRRAHPPLAADQGRAAEQLPAGAEERRAGRRLESLRQGRDPDGRPPAPERPGRASDAGRFTFASARDSVEDFFTSRLLTDVSDVVVIEGDSPLRDADLRVFVAPPPAAGQTLLIRERRDRAGQQRARVAAMERLLGEPDGAARLLEQLVGGQVVAFARSGLICWNRRGWVCWPGSASSAPLRCWHPRSMGRSLWATRGSSLRSWS